MSTRTAPGAQDITGVSSTSPSCSSACSVMSAVLMSSSRLRDGVLLRLAGSAWRPADRGRRNPAQLESARRCQDRFGISFPLIEADAGAVPLPSGRFDLAISECGASLWCDPARWVPEAARLLRQGGGP